MEFQITQQSSGKVSYKPGDYVVIHGKSKNGNKFVGLTAILIQVSDEEIKVSPTDIDQVNDEEFYYSKLYFNLSDVYKMELTEDSVVDTIENTFGDLKFSPKNPDGGTGYFDDSHPKPYRVLFNNGDCVNYDNLEQAQEAIHNFVQSQPT